MSSVIGHTQKVIFFMFLTMFMGLIEHFIKDKMQQDIMRTVKEDLVQSILQAPVSTFFDVVPVSKIQGKINGDIWCICGLFWWANWVVCEFIEIGTTIYMIAQTDYTVLLALFIMVIYLYRGQLYANKTRPEMNRAYCMFMH